MPTEPPPAVAEKDAAAEAIVAEEAAEVAAEAEILEEADENDACFKKAIEAAAAAAAAVTVDAEMRSEVCARFFGVISSLTPPSFSLRLAARLASRRFAFSTSQRRISSTICLKRWKRKGEGMEKEKGEYKMD